jgi:Mg2+ and Co2+ transporter CorA
MDVYRVFQGHLEQREEQELPGLLAEREGFVWVDIDEFDQHAAALLGELFGAHPLALRDCLDRSHVPKVRAYTGHVFLILHDAWEDARGHAHRLEVQEFAGDNFLVTVHGPRPGFSGDFDAHRDTRLVVDRIASGRFAPATPSELAHAITSAIIRRMEQAVARTAGEIDTLEEAVLEGRATDPHLVSEELFRHRHELLTIGTIAAQDREVYARLDGMKRLLPEDSQHFVADSLDQFSRLHAICDEEREFLQGVVDLHESRMTAKMNTAMERLALLVAMVTPVTAVASIYGMNIIVSNATQGVQLTAVLATMGVMTGAMAWWTKRQGWW